MSDWVPIPGFPEYSVSRLGQVRNDRTERLLHVNLNQYGVPFVGLMLERQQRQRSLALLVARAFLPVPPEAFDTPININGDRLDCHEENLMWRPRWFAIQFNQQFKERYENAFDVPVRAIETEEEFPNTLEVAKRYGLLERDVVLSMLNKTYVWPTYQLFELA